MATPLVQAALSHYIAKRDKSIAELGIYLNHPVGVGEHAHVSDEVIKLFAELDNAESVIRTIRDIVQENEKSDLDKIKERLIALSTPAVPASDSITPPTE